MRVAIIGCGQLARLLALSGLQIGVRCSFLAEPEEDVSSVDGLGPVIRRVEGGRPRELLAALGNPDVVTIERESVDITLLRALSDHCVVHPHPDAVATLQHRLREKDLVASLGLDTAPYRGVKTGSELRAAIAALGLPVIAKSCLNGYDGRGQWRLQSEQDLVECADDVDGSELLVESLIPFDREISILAVRSASGEVALYPATENLHQDGILMTSVAPSTGLPAVVQDKARDYAAALLRSLDYVGVLAIECFVVDDRLLINELAPRVHNSGHWTLRSEATSQFENHLRAILGLPLGETRVSRCEGIVNILGQYNRVELLQRMPRKAALVDYNKSAAPRRKLGHVHVSSPDHDELMRELGTVRRVLYQSAPVN